MNEKTEIIFSKYEDIMIDNLERYEKGEVLDAAAINALNDCIRIIHHITKLRNSIFPDESL